MSSNQRIEFPELVKKILENVIKINQSRYFIAISGAPASGKSTISEKLKSELILNTTNQVFFKWMVSTLIIIYLRQKN